MPANSDTEPYQAAKGAAKKATEEGREVTTGSPHTESKMISTTRERIKRPPIPSAVGKFSKTIDAASPGKHTRTIYDKCNKKEARPIPAEDWMSRLNSYLRRIRAAPSVTCECGLAKESIWLFLFQCPRWRNLRGEMREQTTTRRGNLSFYSGGMNGELDPLHRPPSISAVRAAIRFAIKTGRLEVENT